LAETESTESKPEPIEPGAMVLMAVVFEGSLALVALVAGWLTGYDPAASLKWNWHAVGWGVVATAPPLAAMLWCTNSPLSACRSLTGLVQRTLLPYFERCTLLDLAVISLAAGIGEELLFRGLLQTVFDGWFGAWGALVAASIVFGLAHFITPTYALFAIGMGAWLGGVWLWSGNLLAPLVTHALYDCLTLVYLIRMKGES
jgi:membrane protease YdiL (CAAX protease family)